ncbi:MAG: YlbF family regulator [Bacilli bacterium]|nr:YlbF family regulator [Bacilli bacterium]
MEEKTLNALMNLREALRLDPRIAELSMREEELNASDEVKELRKKVDEANENYSFAVNHYGESNNMSKEALHSLYLAKKSLGEHPLSRRYNEAYSTVRKLYDEIDMRLLGAYRARRNCTKC